MYIVILFAALLTFVLANVEKTIFLGPETVSIPTAHPNLDDLSLIPLSPLHSSYVTRLNASFPSKDTPKGWEHWFLLDGLSDGARYEVRICWLATQPTAFTLDTFTFTQVFDDTQLLTSLSTYAYARHAEVDDFERQKLVARRAVGSSSKQAPGNNEVSILFLRIFAAADYYTLNKDLMKNVQPVDVEIILDPFLWNVFPVSLLPTAGYIVVVAIAGWFLSGYVSRRLSQYLDAARKEPVTEPVQKNKKNS